MPEVEDYLQALQPVADETIEWPGGFVLRVQTFLTPVLPPAALLTSARGIVFRGEEVLVVTDRSPSTHILPGGRLEPGELPADTVVREVAEETGWEVLPGAQIGVRFLHHLNPRPEGYAYPYPDFFQVVHTAEAVRHRPALKDAKGWETHSQFMPAHDIATSVLTSGERALLAAAFATVNHARDIPD